MIYTIAVYSLLTIGMLLFYSLSKGVLCNGIVISKRKNIPIIAILLFSLVFGIRYDVGVDHLAYLEKYLNYQIFHHELDFEVGYMFLVKFFADAGAHFSIFFGFLAFVQLFLICFALREHYKVVGWVFFIFMFSTTFLTFLNVIRQNVAFCFEFVALFYLAKKKYLLTYLNIVFAILFHLSAVVLLPLPLFFMKNNGNYFNNISLQVVLFVFALFVGVFVRPAMFIFSYISGFAAKMGYLNYAIMVESGDMRYMELSRELGLGFLLIALINYINIINSNKIKSFYNSRLLNIIYDFYFLGVLYNYIVTGSLILGRLEIYFYNFSFIISAFTLYYLSKRKKINNILMLLIMVMAYLGIWGAAVILRAEDNHAIYKTFLY